MVNDRIFGVNFANLPSDYGSPYDVVFDFSTLDSPAARINPNPNPIKLLPVSFNQDYDCFAADTNRGFRIYNCDPFREIFCRVFDGSGGVGAVEMLFRCNILALVGGGDTPQYPLNKVMIWDDHQNRFIGELSFRSQVRGVRLRRDRIVVVLEQKIFMYNFAHLKIATIYCNRHHNRFVERSRKSTEEELSIQCKSQSTTIFEIDMEIDSVNFSRDSLARLE